MLAKIVILNRAILLAIFTKSVFSIFFFNVYHESEYMYYTQYS